MISVAFLLVGAYMITTGNDYDIREDTDDRKSFLKDFSGWMVNLGKNIKEVGEVTKNQDWLPEYEERNATDTAK
jgi:hypothetical protein